MKRSPLKRRKPINPRRKARRSGRVRDEAYLAKVRGLRCVLWNLAQCAGWVEAHHAGPHPAGRKCSDHEAHPFCKYHHSCWHAHSGYFFGMTRANRRYWADQQIAATQAKLGYRAEGE